jgi:3-hydroxyacyl-CoA dehydrogenase / enoyl-CoA hydratase / 3-hydroxybutyryl-CoA epimerase
MMTETIRFELSDGIATLTMDETGSSVNTMCAQWQRDLDAVTQQVVRERAGIRGVILASAKTSFFAGADLTQVINATADDAVAVFHEVEQIKQHFRTLETLGIPVVTCINGHALGGGWEVALVGHYRVAIDDPHIQLGLPEVTLGLIPGGSGITKMTRLLGLAKAQPFLVEGQLFTPEQAHSMGLVGALVAPGADAQAALRAQAIEWINANPASQQPWDVKGYRIPGGGPLSPSLAGAISVAPAMLRKKTRGLLPAPEYALGCMVEGALVDFDTALRIESRYLARLWTGPVARNLINTFFFNMNAIKAGGSRPAAVPRHRVQKVGVLGAGMMGAGIAYAQARKGIQTVLLDQTEAVAERGKLHSERLSSALVRQGRLSEAAQKTLLSLIEPTDDYGALTGCDLIIEAVYENRAVKEAVTREALPHLSADGFFASNTSTLPISGLAQTVRQPNRFIGIHFFSPVDKMRVVEIIRGEQTDDDTLAKAYDYVQQIGKLPIVVNDARGFYTSRTFGTFVMEGAAMLGEGIPAAVIENAAMQCGMPVGPLAVLDETALSLSVQVLDQTRSDYKAMGKTYQASAGELLVERMVKVHNRSGRAVGAGFYDYPEGAKKQLWPDLKTLFERPDATVDIPTIQDRILYRQAVETARCLDEGVLQSVHDANIGSLFAVGFPIWTGGTMQFIYGQGIAAFEAKCAVLADQFGAGFHLSESVKATIARFKPLYQS